MDQMDKISRYEALTSGGRRRPPYKRKRHMPRRGRVIVKLGVLLILIAAAATLFFVVDPFSDLHKPGVVTDRGMADQPPVPEEIAQKIAVSREQKRVKEAQAKAEAEGTAYVPAFGEVPYLYVKDGVKTCYLTFDDGPSPVTGTILDTLAKEQVPATFFMLGSNVEKYPEIVQRVFAEGHSIGTHSYSHDYQKLYKSDDSMEIFQQELLKTQSAIETAIGTQNPNKLFRFPGGSFEKYKQPYKEVLVKHGCRYIDWNCLNGDAEKQCPTADYLMTSLKKTSYNKEDIVVLMHDAYAKKITAETLPQMISYLKEQGYEFRAMTFTGEE